MGGGGAVGEVGGWGVMDVWVLQQEVGKAKS